MMKRTCLLLLTIATGFAAFAQEEEKEGGFDRSRLFAGGTFGLSFGSNTTFINVSPQLGYRFSDHLAAGAGVNFIYNSVDYGGLKDRLGYAGLNVFGRVYPIRYIVLHVQPEVNYSWGRTKDVANNVTYKYPGKLVPSLLAGGGANIPTGRAGAMTVMYLYDVIGNERSPYSNKPFLSLGFNMGL